MGCVASKNNKPWLQNPPPGGTAGMPPLPLTQQPVGVSAAPTATLANSAQRAEAPTASRLANSAQPTELGVVVQDQMQVRRPTRPSKEVQGSHSQRAKPPTAATPAGVTLRGFGKYRFKGAAAWPYLTKFGLQNDVLESASWTQHHADAVASALVQWAASLGATHVCHWTQPLRNANGSWRTGMPTRMVHSLFKPDAHGNAVSILDGKYLLFGEGDSHKMIDVTSPCWVRGDTLFVPSVFAQYNNTWEGDPVMDEKTVLLRSMQAVSAAGVRLLGLLGHQCAAVVPKIGLEQEFYLVPRHLYERRPDLRLCGRTLIGSEPDATELYDMHSTPLNPVAQAVMAQVQSECFALGIALRTRHREGGPNQYEYAPHFGLATVQIDENLLVMEIIEEVARAHGLVALFHEKPFAGVSGSGKHNNFSLATDTGLNLFDEQHVNTIDAGSSYDAFPTLMSAVCSAMYVRGDLVLASVATPGNDFRLTQQGAAEAPPLTISVHVGEALTAHLQEFAASGMPPFAQPMAPFAVPKETHYLGIASVDAHGIVQNKEPRNRTAPFPYAGGRFELRALGSSQNPSLCTAVLCTALAEAFNSFSIQIEAGKSARAVAAASLNAHGLAVIFNGDHYAAEWKAEAERRGIFSAQSAFQAMGRLATAGAAALFDPLEVYSAEELQTRTTILHENYCYTVMIEARCLLDMLTTMLLPTASRVAAAMAQPSSVLRVLHEKLEQSTAALRDAIQGIDLYDDDSLGQARLCSELRLGLMCGIREQVGKLEAITPAAEWPLATIKELLFDDMAGCRAPPLA